MQADKAFVKMFEKYSEAEAVLLSAYGAALHEAPERVAEIIKDYCERRILT